MRNRNHQAKAQIIHQRSNGWQLARNSKDAWIDHWKRQRNYKDRGRMRRTLNIDYKFESRKGMRNLRFEKLGRISLTWRAKEVFNRKSASIKFEFALIESWRA